MEQEASHIEESVEEPVKEPIKEPVEEPVEDPVEKPVEPPKTELLSKEADEVLALFAPAQPLLTKVRALKRDIKNLEKIKKAKQALLSQIYGGIKGAFGSSLILLDC